MQSFYHLALSTLCDKVEFLVKLDFLMNLYEETSST
jgi:hypothetical protein